MSTYFVGDTVRLSATFRNPANALIDPASVTLTTTQNGSTVTYTYTVNPELVRQSLGNYALSLTLAAAGAVSYQWDGTGLDSLSRSGSFNVLAARTAPASFWTPANDHLVFDNLETLTLTKLDGTTQTILRCLRLPASLGDGMAGGLSAYGNVTRFNIWLQECPIAPELNALLTDATHRHFRINSVSQSVALNLWEVETTADAGIAL